MKIVDFGLLRYVNEGEIYGSYIGMGIGFWWVFEILFIDIVDWFSKFNLKVIDVYSFVMICYEVLIGRILCSEFNWIEYGLVIEGYRLELFWDVDFDLKVFI